MTTFHTALQEQYQALRARNPSYSLRAYARRLQVNSGVLSAVMSGRRRVTHAWATKLVDRMALPPETVKKIERDFGLSDLASLKGRQSKNALLLHSDQFRMIADGLHYSLLSLLETADCNGRVEWMSTRLRASPRTIAASLERMQRLGLVSQNSKGAWEHTGNQMRTSDGISDSAIRKFHEDRLEEAKTSLYSAAVLDRDFLSSTVAISKSKLPMARKLVREFMLGLESVLSAGDKDEVYRIGIQIFPVTEVKKGNIE